MIASSINYKAKTFRIIDVHTHAWQGGKPYAEMVEAMGAIIKTASDYNIETLCVLGDVLRFGHNPSRRQVAEINDNTVQLLEAFPEVLRGFCFVNPRHGDKFLYSEIIRCVKGAGFKGIKLENSLLASDRRVEAVLGIAHELDVPVLHHSWGTAIIGRKQEDGAYQTDPADIAQAASRFPGTKIIMAHLTAAGMNGILEVKNLENVWVDTSGSQPFSGFIEYAVKHLGAARILFGSDITGRDFSSQLGRVLGAGIKDREKELILYKNAAGLLKIP